MATLFHGAKVTSTFPGRVTGLEHIGGDISRLELWLYLAPTYTTFLGRAPDQLFAIEFENGMVSRLQHCATPTTDEQCTWRTIPWEPPTP